MPRPPQTMLGDQTAAHNSHARSPRIRKSASSHDRKGAIIVLAAFMMIALMAMLAFAVDIGYILKVDTDLDRSVDAAALAGAGELINGQAAAEAEAVEFLVRNPAGFPVVVDENNLQARIAEYIAAYGDKIEMEVGMWDRQANNGQGGMVTGVERPSAIRVAVRQNDHPFFFGKLFGKDAFSVYSEAVGSYQPRDIMLVLDYSGSMNDDSEFNSNLDANEVHTNLYQMYEELGSPAYGTLPFDCEWARCKGETPGSSSESQNYVTYKRTEAYVEASKTISSVVLDFSNGNRQYFYPSGNSGTFKGTGTNNGRLIYNVWVNAGSGGWELFDFSPDDIATTVERGLGLSQVAWPGNSGNWRTFITWASNSGNQNNSAGFRYKYGVKNLLVYWMEQKPYANQTPFLWQLSAQPVTAVKNAVDLFVDYVLEVDTDDRMGLAVYNSYSGDGTLETGLTSEMDLVRTIARQRQASHYHNYTNIGGGMAVARQELLSNSREGAFRLMVLMTDGNANWYPGGYNINQGKQYVLDQAALCAAAKIPIMTISLGAAADTNLMQQVADITNGVHYVVPGGQPIAGLQEDLREVFRDIADDRPLQIIK